jgi:hypothetical protein
MAGPSPELDEVVEPDHESVIDAGSLSPQQDSTDVSAAGTSTVEKPGKSMLDAVNTALAGTTEKLPTSKSESDVEGKPKDPAAVDPDELTPAEEKLLPRRTAKTIERFRSQITDFKQQIQSLQPKVQGFDRLVNFVKAANLTPGDLDTGLELVALCRNDPVKAYQQLIPLVIELQRITGHQLPDDLQQEVAGGKITEARAREISVLRAQEAIGQTRTKEQTARIQAQQRQEAVQRHVSTVATTATDWERTKQKADPDWHLKSDRVAELVKLELYEKQRQNNQWFPSQKEAVEMSERALERVNKELKRFGPRPRAISPVTGSASQTARPKPKSLLDVINNTLSEGAMAA